VTGLTGHIETLAETRLNQETSHAKETLVMIVTSGHEETFITALDTQGQADPNVFLGRTRREATQDVLVAVLGLQDVDIITLSPKHELSTCTDDLNEFVNHGNQALGMILTIFIRAFQALGRGPQKFFFHFTTSLSGPNNLDC